MHRFYIPPASWNLDHLALDEGETHHALDVLRMNEGEKAVVFDGRGNEATVELAAVTKKSISLRRLHHAKAPPVACRITLAQAVPKGKNMDLIVQKAVELGASAIAPCSANAPWCRWRKRTPAANSRNGRPWPSRPPSNAARTGCRRWTRRAA